MVLFYIGFEFVILILWMPVLIRKDKDLWSSLKQTKIPLLVLLTISLMAQVYIVVTRSDSETAVHNALFFFGEFCLKVGFLVILVTRLMVAVSFTELSALKFKMADKLMTWSTVISVCGFFIRSFFGFW